MRKAFILHMERATARAGAVEALRAALPIEAEVLPAVDGARLTPAELQAHYVRRRFAPRYPFALVPAEIGVFLSHRAAWRRIVDEGLDWGVVFEDDVALDAPVFAALIELIEAERAAWDHVLLPLPGRTPPGAPVVARGGVALLRPLAPPLGAVGQIVSRAAAERLLALTQPFDRPIDVLMQMTWITGLKSLMAAPTPIRDVSGAIGGTTIGRRTMGFWRKLGHEIRRPIYRARIAARYRRDADAASRSL